MVRNGRRALATVRNGRRALATARNGRRTLATGRRDRRSEGVGVKHLPKHLQPRWRYLAVELTAAPDADLSRGAFQRAVWYAAGNLLGDPGSADADLRVLRFEFADGSGEAVVRVRHGEVGPARAALACVAAVDDHPVGLSVRGVSGTIRTCEEKFLGA